MNPIKKIEITEPEFLERVKDKMRSRILDYYDPRQPRLPFASL